MYQHLQMKTQQAVVLSTEWLRSTPSCVYIRLSGSCFFKYFIIISNHFFYNGELIFSTFFRLWYLKIVGRWWGSSFHGCLMGLRKDAPLVAVIYSNVVFTCVPGESHCRRLGSLLLCLCVMSFECWLTPLLVDCGFQEGVGHVPRVRENSNGQPHPRWLGHPWTPILIRVGLSHATTGP